MLEDFQFGIAHLCLCGPGGTLCYPLRWNGDETRPLAQWLMVQVLDEEMQPIPQPYDTPEECPLPPEPDHWIINLLDPPPGWGVCALTEEQWQQTRGDNHLKVMDHDTMEIKLRPEVEQVGNKIQLKHAADVELCHYMYGGAPCYKIRADSPKTEDDFPDLPFTADPQERKTPAAGLGEIARAVRYQQFLTGTTETPKTGAKIVGIPKAAPVVMQTIERKK